jgi:hypothetical protein
VNIDRDSERGAARCLDFSQLAPGSAVAELLVRRESDPLKITEG